MDDVSPEVLEWILEAFGEDPEALSVWSVDEDMVQILFRLSDKVVISDLSWQDENILEEASLVVRLSNWKPNSILTRRMPDGFVRFTHRSKKIILAPEVRSDQWAAGLLEGWLSDMHGANSVPKSRAQRISGIKRQRDTVTKLIEQANLTTIRNEIDFIDHRLATANRRLTGERPNYSSSEE